MPAPIRLLLALATLTTFWLALFVSDAVNSGVTSAEGTVAPDGEVATVPVPGAAAADLDGAAIDRLLVASREAFVAEQWQNALGPTEGLVARFPGQHVYLARLAEIYGKLGRPADEASTWERFMDRAPLPADACPAIGYAYRRLGQFDRALDAFARCAASDTTNAELEFFVGLASEWLTRFADAETHYQRAIRLATSHADSAVGLARLRLHRNQLPEALTRAAAVLERTPEHVDALLVAGLAEQRAGRGREARRYLEKAATLSDDYFDVYLALGILDFSEAQLAAARRSFERASRLDPGRQDEVQVWLDRTAGVKAAS